jgi:shikimate kinase
MSGAGKSYWARKLATAGFRAISIDDRIEEKLASELAAGSYRGTSGVAAWMGWPNQPSYREREQKYLRAEMDSMREALDEMDRSASEGLVLDTTGSVVYTGDAICRRLKRLTTVVYLEASVQEEGTLIARYLSDPKPVLWGEHYSQRPGEAAQAAVARCYPALIADRKRLYERYAERTVSLARLREAARDPREFLELVEAQVRHAQ